MDTRDRQLVGWVPYGSGGAVLRLRVVVTVAPPDGLRGAEAKAYDPLAWYAVSRSISMQLTGTDRTPEDPLPRRHPAHEHPYQRVSDSAPVRARYPRIGPLLLPRRHEAAIRFGA